MLLVTLGSGHLTRQDGTSSLMCMTRSFLRDRMLIYNIADEKRIKNIAGRTAKRSILGLDLWNFSYDTTWSCCRLRRRYSGNDRRGIREEHGPSLLTEKMEMVLLAGQRIPTNVEMRVKTDAIATGNAVKHLGLCFDYKHTFWEWKLMTYSKTAKIISHLSGYHRKTNSQPTQTRNHLVWI